MCVCVCVCVCVCECVCVCAIKIYGYFVNSPYLLVCGDDRIRSIREHMLLQVGLVRRRAGAGLILGDFYQSFYVVL